MNLYLADGQALAGPIPFGGVGGARLVYESPSRSDIGGLDRKILDKGVVPYRRPFIQRGRGG